MNANAKLEVYTKAMEALDAHITANKEVFDAHAKLVMTIVDAENALRDAVAETKEDIFNGQYKVTVITQSQTVIDEEKLRASLSSNPVLLQDLIKVYERPPRITISKQS